MSDVATVPNGALITFIERASRDPDFDIQKFGELLRMQREVEHDRSRRAFNAAMADAQHEMLPVVRDAKNSHLGNRYAKLETIDAAMRPIYTRHGFSVRYGSAPAPTDGVLRITCTVAHADGYFEENYLDAPLGNVGAQGGRTQTTPVQSVGSTVTYLRRYLLGMVFNIVLADEDDDGEAARSRAAAAATPRPPSRSESATQGYSDDKWRAWLDRTRAAMDLLRSRQEVVEVGERDSVGNAMANGPDWLRRELSALLAEHYARFQEAPEDELPDVEIAGADKMAAGDD